MPPTPMAAAIKDLIMSPLHFSCQPSSEEETVFNANNRYVSVLPLNIFVIVCDWDFVHVFLIILLSLLSLLSLL